MAKNSQFGKFTVRKAKPSELDWLFRHQGLFSAPYNIPIPLRHEQPCFVLVGREGIAGYHNFEFNDVGGERFAWIGRTSLRKGFEGRGLGQFLFGHATAMLHRMGFGKVQVWAHTRRAKKFYAKMGYRRVEGKPILCGGNTLFSLDLASQRAHKRTSRPK